MWKSQRGASTLADLLKLDNWSRFVRSSIVPGALLTHCRLCAQQTSGVDICAGCHADLPWSMHNPPPPRHIGKVWSAFDYGYPIANLIHAAKYDGDITAANLLGRLMVDGCRRQPMQPQGVVFPVPVPRPRLVVRGYNQVVEIARPLGLELGLSIDR